MDGYETIADRRIRAAREAGLFDNLAGAGKPIPDLDRERPPGWWGTRVVKRERSMMRAEELDRELKEARAALWRLPSEDSVRSRVGELNQQIDDYNQITTWEPRARLDVEEIVGQWGQLHSWRHRHNR